MNLNPVEDVKYAASQGVSIPIRDLMNLNRKTHV